MATDAPAPSSTLLALSERVEELSGADRRVDADICELVDLPHCVPPDGAPEVLRAIIARTRSGIWDQDPDCPFYTSSLDAAMTLVPEGWGRIEFGRYEGGGGYWALLTFDEGGVFDSERCFSVAAAITAASLRALASTEVGS